MDNNQQKRVGAGAGVLMLRDGKVLLGLRNSDPAKAQSALRGEGTWTMPGGKLEFGESIEDGIKREVLEETGMVLNDVQVIAVNEEKNQYAHFITIACFSDNFTGEPELKEPDEIVEWDWFDLHNLPEPMFPSSAHIAENYLQNKFYIKRS